MKGSNEEDEGMKKRVSEEEVQVEEVCRQTKWFGIISKVGSWATPGSVLAGRHHNKSTQGQVLAKENREIVAQRSRSSPTQAAAGRCSWRLP